MKPLNLYFPIQPEKEWIILTIKVKRTKSTIQVKARLIDFLTETKTLFVTSLDDKCWWHNDLNEIINA